jgi:hypothetical protein
MTANLTADGTLANADRYANFGPSAGWEGSGWEGVYSVNHGYYGSFTDHTYRTTTLLPFDGPAEDVTGLTCWTVEATDHGWFGREEADRVWALRDQISAAVKAAGVNHVRVRLTAGGEVRDYDYGALLGHLEPPAADAPDSPHAECTACGYVFKAPHRKATCQSQAACAKRAAKR